MKNFKRILSTLTISFLLSNGVFAQNTGFFADFNASLPGNISGTPGKLNLTTTNGELRIQVNKDLESDGITINFAQPLDLSNKANRVINFDLRTDTTSRKLGYTVLVTLLDNNGNTTSSYGLVKNIFPTNKSQKICIPFLNQVAANPSNTPTPINYNSIVAVNIYFQQTELFNANLYLDNIIIGSVSSNNFGKFYPYFKGVPTEYTYINSAPKRIKLEYPVDATDLTNNISFSAVSSNPALISNLTIVNNNLKSNGITLFTNAVGIQRNDLTNAPALLEYSLSPNAIGMATVTVTATSPTTVSGVTTIPYNYVFVITVSPNIAPSIKPIPAQIASSGVELKIELDSVFSGNKEVLQTVSISGTSSDQTVVNNANISIDYTPGNRFGLLRITPTSFANLPIKTTTITLNLIDNGGTAQGGQNSATYQFPLTVFPVFYNKPSFNPIPDNTFISISNPLYRYTITGITDGNGGANISSLTAKSSFPLLVPDPVINYTPGNDYAVMEIYASKIGAATITVTATNTGAPANSNGNGSFSRTFKAGGVSPPIFGYSETFVNTKVRGTKYYNAGSSTSTDLDANTNLFLKSGPSNQNWFAEGQGSYITLSIDPFGQVATAVYNKGNAATNGYFSGIWYTPRSLMDLSNNRYITVKLKATIPTRFQLDLFDVNGNRYGLSPAAGVMLGTTNSTYTFCFTETPSSTQFDISKVLGVLFNAPKTRGDSAVNKATVDDWQAYNGIISISEFYIGNSVVSPNPCPIVLSQVQIASIANQVFLTTQSGPKNITVTGINAGSTFANGLNTNPVSLNIQGSNNGFIATPSASPVSSGVSVLSFNTPATPGTTVVSVTGTATDAFTTTKTFQIVVENVPATFPVTVTNDLSQKFDLYSVNPNGTVGQTMEGFGSTINTDGITTGTIVNPSTFDPQLVDVIKDAGITIGRIAVLNDFEPQNDNSDPYQINKSGFDYDALRSQADVIKQYMNAGVQKIIASSWGHPSWLKKNNSFAALDNTSKWIDNTVDSVAYDELAEYYATYLRGMKEMGVDIYALSFINNPQVNASSYPTTMFNPEQYSALVAKLGKRLENDGIKTLITGPETDYNLDNANAYVTDIASKPNAAKYFSAYGIHNYDIGALGAFNTNTNSGNWFNILNLARNSAFTASSNLYLNHPYTASNSTGNGSGGIPTWVIEAPSGTDDWTNAMLSANQIMNAIVLGNASVWMYTSSQAIRTGNTNTLNNIGQASKHFFKFINVGAKRIGSHSQNNNIKSATFRNPDYTIVSVLINNALSTQIVNIVPRNGTTIPGIFRVFLSAQNSFWNELNTTTGQIILPPQSIVTLWGGAGSDNVLATAINVSLSSNIITIPGASIQSVANVLPSNTSNKKVIWSLSSGNTLGSINSNGLFTGISNGVATISAQSANNASVQGTATITISGQYIPVNSITVNGNDITTNGGTSNMTANILPANATNSNVSWSVTYGTGAASISGTGVLKALANGTVTVTATALNTTNISGSKVINISGQTSLQTSPSSIVIYNGNNNLITLDKVALQLYANVLPDYLLNKAVLWSVSPTADGGLASINSLTGAIFPIFNGTVLVTATHTLSGVNTSLIITITGQSVQVQSLTVVGINNVNTISSNGQKVQMKAFTFPAQPNDTTITWTVINQVTSPDSVQGGYATINSNGLLSPYSNGIVTVVGISNSNGLIKSNWVITITNQSFKKIIVYGNPNINATTYTLTNSVRSLMYASAKPLYLSNKNITWTVINGTGMASVIGLNNQPNASGVNSWATISGIKNGNVSVKVSSATDTSVYTIINIPIAINLSISGTGNITGGSASEKPTANYRLYVQNTAASDVKWKISPEGIATISNQGLLSVNYAGLATLTGWLGSMPLNIISKPLDLTGVSRIRPNSITGIIIQNADRETIDVSAGVVDIGQELYVYANLLPANDNLIQDMIWSSSDTNILVVSNDIGLIVNGRLLIKNCGTVTISGVSLNDTTIKSSIMLNIVNSISPQSSGRPSFCVVNNVQNNDISTNLFISPNPFTESFKFNNSSMEPNAYLEIYSQLGELVYHHSLSEKNVVINTNNWKCGIYVLKYKSTNTTKTFKLIKR
ncbi:MAG: Ig-like domain-containing protein [Bacteroidota bacterium]|nr:Ig-like domain-containing protein [Bacteroidota bacterium]